MLHSWCVMLWCPRISILCLHFLFHTSLLPPCLSPSFLRSVLPSFLPNFLHTSNSLSLFPILPFSLPLPLSFPRSLSPSRLPPSSDHYTVEVPLPRLAFQMLPHEIKEGKALQVYPVLFNVGINEQQTIADRYRNTFVFYGRIISSTLVTNVHLFSHWHQFMIKWHFDWSRSSVNQPLPIPQFLLLHTMGEKTFVLDEMMMSIESFPIMLPRSLSPV